MTLFDRLWHELKDFYTDNQYTSTALRFDMGDGKDHTRDYVISYSERRILAEILNHWRSRISH